MTICGYCGYKFEEDKIETIDNAESANSRKTVPNIKVFGILGICILAICIGSVVYLNSASTKYKKAQKQLEANQYLEAAEIFDDILDYEDSQELYKKCKYEFGKDLMEQENFDEAQSCFDEVLDYEDSKDLSAQCQHMIDVKNDSTSPVLSGIKEEIKVKAGTEFNIKDYVKEHIVIEDDVTTDITDYSVLSESKRFDQGTGKIDTWLAETSEITITAKDEAGNEGNITTKVIVNPIHVTKKNPNPTVYDGEFGTVKVKSFKHGYIDGSNEYQILFDVYNKTDKNMIVYLPYTTSINDYQVGAYYVIRSIAPGKKGTMDTCIYDDDIKAQNVGDFNQIDSEVCFMNSDEDKPYCWIPIVFDTNAAK